MSAAGYASVGSATRGVTLADALFPHVLRERATAWQRDMLLVAAGVVLITAGAWVSFSLPAIAIGDIYVPVNPYVPLTLQTFGVLFTGALLGAGRGVAATSLYLLLGIVGLPVFAADPETGIHPTGIARIATLESGQLVLGTTGGYLIGFVVAAAVVGRLAELGWDRRLASSVAAMVIGSIVIYAIGVSWLALAIDAPIPQALTFGLYPFLPGDIAKLLVAAGLLPIGWRLASERASGPRQGPREPGGGSSGRR
jgi:biotin transport system substrate-specific component